MILIKKAEVGISEQTLRELLMAVEKAKEKLAPFCDEPMPNGDMTVEKSNSERAKRGSILISSPFCGISYRVELNRQHEQESGKYESQINIDEI